MADPGGPPERTAPQLDELRRRLYRPGATEQDRESYLRLRATIEPTAVATAPDPRNVPRPRRRLLRIAAPLGVVLLVAGLVLALQSTRTVQPMAAPTRTPLTAPQRVVVLQPSEGQLRAESDGRSARRSPRPDSTIVPISIDGLAAIAHRFHGTGSADLPLDDIAGPDGPATVVVLLTSTGRSPLRWVATRHAHRDNYAVAMEVVASGVTDPSGGAARPAAERYSGPPPTRISVRATEREPWALLVALVPPTADDLR